MLLLDVRYRTGTGGRTMYYVGIDVASQESAACILDSKGKIVREAKISTDPEALGNRPTGRLGPRG